MRGTPLHYVRPPPHIRRVLQLEQIVRRSAGPAWAPPPGEAWVDEDGSAAAAAAAAVAGAHGNTFGVGGMCTGRAGRCGCVGNLAGAFADALGPPPPEPTACAPAEAKGPAEAPARAMCMWGTSATPPRRAADARAGFPPPPGSPPSVPLPSPRQPALEAATPPRTRCNRVDNPTCGRPTGGSEVEELIYDAKVVLGSAEPVRMRSAQELFGANVRI